MVNGPGGGLGLRELGPITVLHPLLKLDVTRLISSYVDGPFSVSQRNPVIGSTPRPKLFRIPIALYVCKGSRSGIITLVSSATPGGLFCKIPFLSTSPITAKISLSKSVTKTPPLWCPPSGFIGSSKTNTGDSNCSDTLFQVYLYTRFAIAVSPSLSASVK